MGAVMGMSRAESGAYVAHKVGRRSVAKRPQWWTEAISLLPADGSKANKFAQYKLWKRKAGGLSVSSGDMGAELHGDLRAMKRSWASHVQLRHAHRGQ